MNYQTAISFGLVHIPVLMNSAIKNNDISFNMLHKKCGEKLEYVRYCPHCKEDVKNKDIEKGYEYTQDNFITFSVRLFSTIYSYTAFGTISFQSVPSTIFCLISVLHIFFSLSSKSTTVP